jgi:hypothetical protein
LISSRILMAVLKDVMEVARCMAKTPRATKEHHVWPGVTSDELFQAMREHRPDPRAGLTTSCMYIGQASASLAPSETLSFCYPQNKKCMYRVCFSVRELSEYIRNKKGKSRLPNPFYDEICEKIPRHKKYVTKTLTPAFQELVIMQSQAVENAGAKDSTDAHTTPVDKADTPFLAVTTQLFTSFVKENPEALASGGILHKAKYWLRRTAASVAHVMTMIFSHPVYGSLLILLSRLLRLFVCLQLSGARGDAIDLVLAALQDMIKSNPVTSALIGFLRSAIACIPRHMVDVRSKLECLKRILGSSATTAWVALSKYPRQFLVYAFQKLFIDTFDASTMMGGVVHAVGTSVQYLNESIDHPRVIWDVLAGGKGLLRTNIRLLLRNDLFWLASRTIFLGVLFTIPVQLITVVLNAMFLVMPAALTDLKHQLITVAQRVTGDDRYSTVGHIFLAAVRLDSMRGNVLFFLEEAYTVFMTFGKCFVERVIRSTTSSGSVSCCVDPLVQDILAILRQPPQGILAYAQKVLTRLFL